MLAPWLGGKLMLDPAIARFVRPVPVHAPAKSWPVAEAVHAIELSAFRMDWPCAWSSWDHRQRRATFAAAAAHHLGIECIAVDTTAVSGRVAGRF
jgi:hypothetical protein